MPGATPIDLFLNVLPFHDEVERNSPPVCPSKGARFRSSAARRSSSSRRCSTGPRDWADIEAMVEARSFDVEPRRVDWIRQMLGDDRRIERMRRAGSEAPLTG